MRALEVRRHAERADRSDEHSGLSESGRAMCLRLGRDTPAYALVVASPLPRAMETARLIGGRLDRVEGALLPDLHGLPFGFWEGLRDLAAYWDLHRRSDGARRLGAEQAALWASLVSSLAEGESGLAVSHGAVIELGAVALAAPVSVALDGPVFGYCEGIVATFERDAAIGVRILRIG